MTLTIKDIAATAITALAVLVFAATHEGWDVPLVGDRHRWAAAIILVLGMATCGLGSPGRDAATKVLAALGVAALALGVLALATGSMTPLSLLVLDIVVLWGAATLRHVVQPPRRPITT